MIKATASYNERSWAIDLIGHLKQLSKQNNRSIKDAGGEQTIRAEGGSLYPDVLLFGDRETARILQGWELKMPDTSIDDYEFCHNAEIKAKALGLNSFLLWNVSYAQLYVWNDTSNKFECHNRWSELSDISNRRDVVSNRKRWENLAGQILNYLNDLFDNEILEGRQFIEAYRNGGVTSLIMENAEGVSEAIVNASNHDLNLRSGITLWWNRYQAEYARDTMEHVLAKAVISNWIGKILFAHILREQDQRSREVATISDDMTPAEALILFRNLSENCNFWTIFSDSLGLSLITEQTWNQLNQFNRLLNDLRVGSVDQVQLSGILEATVQVATRKLRGQYPTPVELAHLLVRLCMRDIISDRIFDPCCGSGTIVRAALEQKLTAGVAANEVSQTIFAADQDPQAVQLATFALVKPNLMHEPLRLFQKDVFTLTQDTTIEFRNPSNGNLFTENLGQFQAITSNLPFVAQAGRKQYGNAINQVRNVMGIEGRDFTARADISAYIPFTLHALLVDGGRLGIIITNAWLGTDWGDDFYRLLQQFYDLKSVITSGAGRWFQNSEVVTNILIMEKKTNPRQPNSNINFIVLTRPIQDMAEDNFSVQIAAAQIELGQKQNDTMTIRSISPSVVDRFRLLGLGGNAQFVNCDWVLSLPLVPLNTLFAIRRGERRGNNKLFYPAAGHGIEAEYIRPLAKNLSEFTRLTGQATKEAFSCARTEAELQALGHTGALNWINRFNSPENIAKLGKGGRLWYSMNVDGLADIVMTINYGNRLFVPRLNPPAFADQRLISFEPHEGIDVELCHALLNSTISMFIIEGMGFGRGLGALDLNKNRIEDYMNILDPSRLGQVEITSIKSAFEPLLRRKVLNVADELEMVDRQAFDDTVILAYNLNIDRRHIYDCLLSLITIRMTAI